MKPEGAALVLGGRGLMGGWFVRFLESEGYSVRTHDVRGRTRGVPHVQDWLGAIRDVDLVVFATPMDETAALLRQTREKTEAALVEMCSIKAPVARELRSLSRAGMTVASIHPMWGPDADLLSDKSLLVVDCGSRSGVQAAKRLFRRTAVNIHDVRLADHDALMAWSLGLPHATNLVFSAALSKSGIAPSRLSPFGGPTFRAQIENARAVAKENKDLYYQIQALNPHTKEVQRAIERSVAGLYRSLQKRAEFRAFMRSCERYYNGSRHR